MVCSLYNTLFLVLKLFKKWLIFIEMGNLCIVMDFCEGGDLFNKIQTVKGQGLGGINEEQVIK